MDLPEKFVRLMTESHGARGTLWLAELPALIGEIEENWSLKAAKPFENLSYHFVAPCELANGGEAVLKIGFPEANSPVFNEAQMLKLYDGSGAVKFLQLDEKLFALLLEKLNPGEHLKRVFPQKPEKTVETAIEILRKIKRKPPEKHNFVFLEDWFEGFERAVTTNFSKDFLKKARRFYEELSRAEKFLIHGDFHHENILSAGREQFLAIDPKGIVGQTGYEIGVFLNNHVRWLKNEANLREKLNQAVVKFSEAFEIEPQALRKWAYAQVVLSAWWTFEENGKNWQTDLALADVWEV
jgi:streptomycin 6-kinase